MFTIDGHCGHCRQRTAFNVIFATRYNRRRGAPNPGDLKQAVAALEALARGDMAPQGCAIGMCQFCQAPNLILFTAVADAIEAIAKVASSPQTLHRDDFLVNVTAIYPSLEAPEAYASWPPRTRRLFTEAEGFLRQKISPSTIIAALRTILDITVRELGADGKNLNDQINDLRAKGTITEALAEWSHHLRRLGNAAVHEADATEQDAEELLDFTRTLLIMCVTLPETMKAKAATGPKA